MNCVMKARKGTQLESLVNSNLKRMGLLCKTRNIRIHTERSLCFGDSCDTLKVDRQMPVVRKTCYMQFLGKTDEITLLP
jgi:hypothetical protein